MAGQELLRLEGIGVRFGGREILRDVSFTVRAGEFTGLIGPNRAGKTTLLKVILGLQAPTSGRVLLNGRPRPRRGGEQQRVMIAHDMNPLMRETDTVVYVAAGRAAAGRTDDVIRTEVLSALYGSHVDVLHVHGRVLVVAGDEPDPADHPLEAGVAAAGGGG
jgi:ABC-type Mn2+/Zn2+ transport system ATPase subunit